MNKSKQICPHAKKCGGCQLLNLSYEEQLKHKQEETIRLLGKFCHVEEIIGMENPYNYRNKAQYAFGRGRKGETVAGVYQSSTHKIVDIEKCMLTDPKADEIANTVKKLLRSFKLKPYDENTRQGFLRHVLVKTAFKSGEVMVVLVTATPQFPSKRSFINALVGRHPEITTIVQNVNDKFTSMVLGNKSEVLYGDGKITEELCGLKFRISPKAFYQINPIQTEILYNKALEYANLGENDTVFDIYCGIGTISLFLAQKATKVYGIEIVDDAINDANKNKELNNKNNIEFILGKTEDNIDKFKDIDLIIVDPPREGLDKKTKDNLLRINPKEIVYVSCEASTLMRDLNDLKNNYNIKEISVCDMFPNTYHVETICLLEKK